MTIIEDYSLKIDFAIYSLEFLVGIGCFCHLTVQNPKIFGKRPRKAANSHIFRAEINENLIALLIIWLVAFIISAKI